MEDLFTECWQHFVHSDRDRRLVVDIPALPMRQHARTQRPPHALRW
jgi:hypothetical protein